MGHTSPSTSVFSSQSLAANLTTLICPADYPGLVCLAGSLIFSLVLVNLIWPHLYFFSCFIIKFTLLSSAAPFPEVLLVASSFLLAFFFLTWNILQSCFLLYKNLRHHPFIGSHFSMLSLRFRSCLLFISMLRLPPPYFLQPGEARCTTDSQEETDPLFFFPVLAPVQSHSYFPDCENR